jgi:hypothetical protein
MAGKISDINNVLAAVVGDELLEVTATPSGTPTTKTVTPTVLTAAATAHAASDGTSHTFIDQDVSTSGSPSFAAIGAQGSEAGELWATKPRFLNDLTAGATFTLTINDQSSLYGLSVTGIAGASSCTIGSGARTAFAESCVLATIASNDDCRLVATGIASALSGCYAEASFNPSNFVNQCYISATGNGSFCNVLVAAGLALAAISNKVLASGIGAKIFGYCVSVGSSGDQAVTYSGNGSFGQLLLVGTGSDDLTVTCAAPAGLIRGYLRAGTMSTSSAANGAFMSLDMEANGQTASITGKGSTLLGQLTGTADMTVAGSGSLAVGVVDGSVALSLSGDNAMQLGPGTNAEDGALQCGIAGTGIAIKGTDGVFAAANNGQIYNNAGIVEIQSGGTQIKLVQSSAYTTTGVAGTPLRTIADGDSTDMIVDVLATLINDLKLTGLLA